MPKRLKIGESLTCRECGAKFIFTSSMKQGRKYCSRICYKEACRDFESRPYPQVWYKGKKEYLHRVIYMEANPNEPELTVEDIIHHKDENPFNRSPENLERLTGDARLRHLEKHNFNRRNGYKPSNDGGYDPEMGF